ncbi:sigma 54-interacting transcriptional regulator [Pseudodesulfovibrio tunisiensis]|uniref:sigma 54-interacting transcriptional regulator n=1 Tax=Pseudodesulfovibrio tunisiensis TaxID=463192 RepID=UPI001FB259BF|nr:sigma 54-interacting transcriptional regulator [Pseudodesulfovibrio tunisiensis]
MSTIFIAESDIDILRLVRDLLERSGHAVVEAADLEQAVAVLERVDPDLVFCAVDLMGGERRGLMEEMSRFGREAPVILVSDRLEPDPPALTMSLGAFAYIGKPVGRSRLEYLTRHGLAERKRRQREKRLAGNMTRMHSLLEALVEGGNEAVFVLGPAGRITHVGGTGAAYLGRTVEELLGNDFLSVLPKASVHLYQRLLDRARRRGTPGHVEEYRGNAVYDAMLRPVADKGELLGFVVVARDVTARYQSEQGLAESEKRYRSVYEAARDAIIMIDKQTGAILDFNTAAKHMYGYEAEELARLEYMDLSADPERSMGLIRSGLERLPLRHHRKKDGTVFPVEITTSHFVHQDREVCTVYIQDISHRKIAEEALREGARLYRAVVEDQTELITRFQPDGVLTFVNPACARFLNRDEDDLVGQNFLPWVPEKERAVLLDWMHNVSPENDVCELEQPLQHWDGEWRWFNWTNRAIYDHRGNLTEIQAVGRDITDRRKAEHALERANLEKERYRLNLEATFRSIPDAIIAVDSRMRVIATNSAAAVLCAARAEEAQGKPLRDLVPPTAGEWLGVLDQVVRTGKAVRGYETQVDLPNLGERMVEIHCSPLIDEETHHVGAVLVVRDVSRIADLEKRLQERLGFRGIVGRSSRMQEIYRLLEQLSQLDSTVLILGESGTGKELVAEALHYGGARAGGPLVKVNCSALTESLLESELFGHVRGAFTGAVKDKVGRIQAAQGGTLFLDEIGDIAPLIQLKLLRFLEQKEYERVGESATRSADVRILAATNADLMEKVRQGIFREDLFYRLNVMPINLPPLRERQADIPLLVEHFLEVFGDQFNKTFTGLSPEVLDLIMKYDWPGNIRELKHLLEHACILSPSGKIGLSAIRGDLVDHMRRLAGQSHASDVHEAPLSSFRRDTGPEAVAEAMLKAGGNKVRAARILGVHRATLYRKLRAYGLDY